MKITDFLLAVCAGLAAFGFRGRITSKFVVCCACVVLIWCIIAIGVDLGTTFSVVGINKHGKVIIVEDKHKHRIFPSVVSYLDNGGASFINQPL